MKNKKYCYNGFVELVLASRFDWSIYWFF